MGHLPASGVGSGKLCPLLWVPVSSAARRGDNPSFIRLRQPRRKIMEPTCHSRVTTSPDISVTRCCPPAARREDSGCDGGHGGSPNTLVVRRSGRCYFWHLPKRGTPSPRVLQTYFRCKGKQFSGTGTLQHVVRAQLRPLLSRTSGACHGGSSARSVASTEGRPGKLGAPRAEPPGRPHIAALLPCFMKPAPSAYGRCFYLSMSSSDTGFCKKKSDKP